jgi:hypothetical protein
MIGRRSMFLKAVALLAAVAAMSGALWARDKRGEHSEPVILAELRSAGTLEEIALLS